VGPPGAAELRRGRLVGPGRGAAAGVAADPRGAPPALLRRGGGRAGALELGSAGAQRGVAGHAPARPWAGIDLAGGPARLRALRGRRPGPPRAARAGVAGLRPGPGEGDPGPDPHL